MNVICVILKVFVVKKLPQTRHHITECYIIALLTSAGLAELYPGRKPGVDVYYRLPMIQLVNICSNNMILFLKINGNILMETYLILTNIGDTRSNDVIISIHPASYEEQRKTGSYFSDCNSTKENASTPAYSPAAYR